MNYYRKQWTSFQTKILSNTCSVIIFWCSYWFLILGISQLILNPMGITYRDSPFFMSLYFIFSSFLGAYLLRFHDVVHYHRLDRAYLFKVLMIYMLYIAITSLVGYIFPVSLDKIDHFKRLRVMFVYFDPITSLAKSAEIFFQQSLIFILILRLTHIFSDRRKNIVFTFGLAFFILHIPLVITMPTAAFYFIFPSLIAGVLFSYSIIYYKNGLLLSHSIHLGFYVLLGIFLRYMS